MNLLPRQAVPPLEVATLDGSPFVLGVSPPLTFDMIVFYRGLHCPLCNQVPGRAGTAAPGLRAVRRAAPRFG
jgi:hypothetical protein